MKAHLANHERTKHPKTAMAKPRSITEMQSVRALMSKAQLLAQAEIDCKQLVMDAIHSAVECDVVVGGWIKKEDGRKGNKGAEHRQGRSHMFKRKIVLDYERYAKQYLENKHEIAAMVADIKLYCVSPDQVQRWYKTRDQILLCAKNRDEGKSSRKKLQNGRS